MRELKNYFCNYEQTKELHKLGIKFDSLAYYFNHEGKNYFASSMDYFENQDLIAPLRSQALDYFRELGYDFNPYKSTNQLMVNGSFNYIITTILDRYQSKLFFETYHEAESALIDKLIQIEKEARNG